VPMFREVGDKLGEANCIKRLGDIALRRSDHAGAKARYEEAVARYREFGDPYSLGRGLAYLGKVLDGAARAAAVAEARQCFAGIVREDLLKVLDGWFPDLAEDRKGGKAGN